METEIKKGRATRIAQVQHIAEKVKDSESLIINDYRGLTVSQISEVRREIAPLGAKMHIHKNKLMKIALSEAGYPEEVNEHLQGPSAFTYIKGDVSPVLKSLFKYVKDDAYRFSVKGAYIDGVVVGEKKAEAISKLPSRDILLSQLLSVMQGPTRKLAVGLNDVIARLARVLKEVSNNK